MSNEKSVALAFLEQYVSGSREAGHVPFYHFDI